MGKRRRPGGNPAKAAWEPLAPAYFTEDRVRLLAKASGADEVVTADGHEIEFRKGADVVYVERVYRSTLYQCSARTFPNGLLHLSIHRNDRAAVRDWRHLQAIKNEIAGPEREACELYPAESRLMDEANEYHLWVLPEGERFPFGTAERTIQTPEQVAAFNAQREAEGVKGRAGQRGWQPEIPTGPNLA